MHISQLKQFMHLPKNTSKRNLLVSSDKKTSISILLGVLVERVQHHNNHHPIYTASYFHLWLGRRFQTCPSGPGCSVWSMLL